MSVFQFRLRSLFIVTTLAAILTLPAYEFGLKTIRFWNRQDKRVAATLPTFKFTTVEATVSVSDGGTILITGSGIRMIKPDGTKWVNGEQILKDGRRRRPDGSVCHPNLQTKQQQR